MVSPVPDEDAPNDTNIVVNAPPLSVLNHHPSQAINNQSAASNYYMSTFSSFVNQSSLLSNILFYFFRNLHKLATP